MSCLFRFLRNTVISIIVILFLWINPLFAEQVSCQQHHCIAIVDAGSTGSRLHFYAYDLNQEQQPVGIQELWSKKITPGLATLERNQARIDAYLDTLFPMQNDQEIPVYFYATAGMRLLPLSEQQAYYEQIKHWFSRQTTWKLQAAKTISGREEGVYSWLAVNYGLGALTPNSTRQSVGVMDMGGASVQVVFPLDQTTSVAAKHTVRFTVYGQSYTVFAYSALGLGRTLVTQQFLNHAACFSKDYELADGAPAVGNAETCQQEISSLINSVHHVNQDVQLALDLSHAQSWYVLGGLNYLSQTPVLHLNQAFTSADLLSAGERDACAVDWLKLASTFPDQDALHLACLSASYYYALMVNGYGLSPQELIHLAPEGSDWTLGVILRQDM